MNNQNMCTIEISSHSDEILKIIRDKWQIAISIFKVMKKETLIVVIFSLFIFNIGFSQDEGPDMFTPDSSIEDAESEAGYDLFKLGISHYWGERNEVNKKKAFELFEKSAKNGFNTFRK